MNRRMQKAESARKFRAAWLRALIRQLLAFPAGQPDDRVDAVRYDMAPVQNLVSHARRIEPMDRRFLFGEFTLEPWPCGDCSVEIVRNPLPGGSGRTWNTRGRTITCSSCRAKGAPDYLP